MKKYLLICLFFFILLNNAFGQKTIEEIFPPQEAQQIQTAIQEIRSLNRPSEMPRKIELLNFVLTKITQNIMPELWAALKVEIANSFSQNPSDNRAADLEQAIEHYQLALQVFTSDAFPQYWAATQNNLALAYSDRIRGDRAANLEQAIEHYQLALQVRTREAFPEDWAMTQHNLANAYSDRIRGDRTSNLEQAIEHFQLALQVYTRDAFSEDRALTQHNLANAYSDRIQGDRASNLEQAIEHYQLALQVYTRDAFPEKWAMTQNSLANAYSVRIRGDRAANLEQAIEHYQSALQVYTRDAFPEGWAMTQNNLANAHKDRIRGDRAANLEQAIEHYQLALQVYTREAFPQDWAAIQNNLANAYSVRIRRDRAANLEQAIEYYQLALQVRTREAFPENWAATQNNVANAYWDRIRGDRAANLEQAIAHYQLALQVYTRDAFPEKWALTQNNLANAYRDRLRGERADNLEQAIEHFQLALQVYIRDAFPEDWAATQNNLANAYWYRIRGDRAANLEQAIEYYQLALQVRTREAFPEKWAMTHNNLATAYRDRIQGNRAANLEQAIEHYQLALQVRTREAFPQDFIQTSINLGEAYLKKHAWSAACSTYAAIAEVGEDLLTLTAGEDEGAKSLALFQQAFRHHAYALAKGKQYQTALTTLEKGKTRSLNQALLFQKIRTASFNSELKNKFISLQQEMNNLQQQIKQTSDQKIAAYTSLAPELRLRQAEMRKLLQRIQQQFPLETMEKWDLAGAIEKCKRANTALVAIDMTPVGTVLLVSRPAKKDIVPIFIEEFTSDSLAQITWTEKSQQSSSLRWVKLLPQSNEDWTRWCDQQSHILRKLGNWLWPRLDQFLQQEKIQQIIFIPQSELFLYPLHATPFVPLNTNDKSSIYPLERYTIVYTPSLRLYDQLSAKADLALRNKQALFVEDPDGNLGFSFAGQKFLIDQLINKKIEPVLLHQSEITSECVLECMKEAALIHYYGHGYFNWNSPDSSGLKMYSPAKIKKLLTMEKISQSLQQNPSSLVILSACETGMTDVAHSYCRDQYVGLPAGFLRAGAKTVVGSLWTVENQATCLLFIRFYLELLSSKQKISPAEALRRAQLWLMKATPEEIDKVAKVPLGINEKLGEIKSSQNKGIYSNPAYWAAFYVVGNGFAKIE